MEQFFNDYTLKLGFLNANPPQRSAGKKIAEWTFVASGSKIPVPVAVFMVYQSGSFFFRAESDQLPNGNNLGIGKGNLESEDINKLKILVEQKLLSKASEISGIIWEDWLEVVVKGTTQLPNDRDSKGGESKTFQKEAFGATLTVQVNPIKRGIDPKSKQPVTINRNGLVVSFPKPSSIREERSAGSFELPVEKSYVPDTTENRVALTEVLSRLTDLRSRLADFLKQGSVQKTLETKSVNKQFALTEREGR